MMNLGFAAQRCQNIFCREAGGLSIREALKERYIIMFADPRAIKLFGQGYDVATVRRMLTNEMMQKFNLSENEATQLANIAISRNE